jgi:hypothetical protein
MRTVGVVANCNNGMMLRIDAMAAIRSHFRCG